MWALRVPTTVPVPTLAEPEAGTAAADWRGGKGLARRTLHIARLPFLRPLRPEAVKPEAVRLLAALGLLGAADCCPSAPTFNVNASTSNRGPSVSKGCDRVAGG